MRVLLPIVHVPILLVLGGLASSTHVSENHGLLSTSAGWRCGVGSTVPRKSVDEHDMDITTPVCACPHPRSGMLRCASSYEAAGATGIGSIPASFQTRCTRLGS